MRPVYCLSGLGADERVFSKLRIDRSIQPIRWIQPDHRESLANYAFRLKAQIAEPNPILIGLSFGGMMAIELARLMPESEVILISSVKTRNELPAWMRGCGRIKAYHVLPAKPLGSIKALRALRPIQNYFLGVESVEEMKMANDFRDHVDPIYLKWAIAQVLTWQNTAIPNKIVHIHGTRDHIFPVKNILEAIKIPGGGHFMVMNKSDEVSRIINRHLQQS